MPTQELPGESGNPRDPFVSPFYAGLAGLPPLYIQAGSDETLLDNSRLFADRARQAGADVRIGLFLRQQHTFQMAWADRRTPTRRCGGRPTWVI
jgi:epsilon-lactone hydrolase